MHENSWEVPLWSLCLLVQKHAHLMQHFEGHFQPSGLTYRQLACISYAVSPWGSPVLCIHVNWIWHYDFFSYKPCHLFFVPFSWFLFGNYPFQMYLHVCTSPMENKWASFHDTYHVPPKYYPLFNTFWQVASLLVFHFRHQHHCNERFSGSGMWMTFEWYFCNQGFWESSLESPLDYDIFLRSSNS